MRIEEVAMKIGTSSQTLNKWYRFKKAHPEDEAIQKLPDYEMVVTSSGKVRHWTEDDVKKLMEFKDSIIIGRRGKMGKYGGAGTHGKKKDRREEINP